MMRTSSRLVFWLCSSLLVACSSTAVKTGPAWTTGPTRDVDNGYIVYVGHGEAGSAESAQFKAEGLALEDLANECSMIPKGTRIEDRFAAKTESGYESFIKIGVAFTECDAASKTLEPDEIKKIANASFTSQLKRYQDLSETGFLPSASESAEIEPPDDIAPAPAQGKWDDRMHFYVTRQYVAYQKEIVILSPPTAYAPSSPETQKFVAAVQPASQQVQGLIQKDATLASKPEAWSRLQERPRIDKPAALRASGRGLRGQELRVPAKPGPARNGKDGRAQGRGQRRGPGRGGTGGGHHRQSEPGVPGSSDEKHP